MSAVYLSSVPKISEATWTEEEEAFISRIFSSTAPNYAVVTCHLKPGIEPKHSDFIDNVLGSPMWDKIASAMGADDFEEFWKKSFVFYETTGNLQLSLNGTMSACSPKWSQTKSRVTSLTHTYVRKGYNPCILIDRQPLMKRKFCSSGALLLSDFSTVRSLIDSQDVGVSGVGENGLLISPRHIKLLKKFCRQSFSLKSFKNKLTKYVKSDKPLSAGQLAPFMNDLLDTYIPRDLVGSHKAFDRFKLNVYQCVVRNPNHPVRLGTLMKGLPTYQYPNNVFLAKFVLFVTTTLGVKLLSELFYVAENLKDKKLMFFFKKTWITFENSSVEKMVASGVLKPSERDSRDLGTSRMRIIHKPKGFRPLVFSSSRHKRIRHRLSVCNTLLKQLVSQVHPGYGKVLDSLHSQWKKIPRIQKERLYFVRTDVSDAFLSINHHKLQEILNRRLSAIPPVQVCRTFVYKSRGRSKSIMQFTTVKPRLSHKKLFIEAGRKVYTTSYLKAVIFQYIKHNYVSHDKKSVYQQIKGVPQGCYLSSVLCELYLSDMDDCYLNHLKTDKEVLVRGVDDYLYITYDLKKANVFLDHVYKGIPEYGITFQLDKTVTNVGSPIDNFPFYGYVFHPGCRKVIPDFSEWTDMIGRMRLYPKMSWRDLSTRATLISYIKLHRLILDPNYLDKFVVMNNIFLCAKIHAQKYQTLFCFLLENCGNPPNMSDKMTPIVMACRVMCARIRSLNQGIGSLSYKEIKLIVLKAYKLILEPNEMFGDVMPQLNEIINRLLLRGGISKRSKKLVKCLTKAKTLKERSSIFNGAQVILEYTQMNKLMGSCGLCPFCSHMAFIWSLVLGQEDQMKAICEQNGHNPQDELKDSIQKLLQKAIESSTGRWKIVEGLQGAGVAF